MNYGTPKERLRYLPKKRKEIIFIVGGSIASVAMAGELGKKGYTVKVYLPEQDSFQSVFGVLDPENEAIWMKDFEIFLTLPVEFYWGELLDMKQIDADSGEIQMVFEEEWMHVAKDKGDSSWIHVLEPKESMIEQLAQGRSMALTIDWAIQKVTTSIGRDKEGSYQTTLFTNLDQIGLQKAVENITGHFTVAESIEEAKRCIHCECLECVKGCGFLQYYHKYPKTAIREIYNNLSIVMGNHLANGFINNC